jgi:hypothetical protein
VTAIRILHGHLALMESSGRYLGALDSYVLAPFIALLGPTVRRALVGNGAALMAATIASVFLIYAVTLSHLSGIAGASAFHRLSRPTSPTEIYHHLRARRGRGGVVALTAT